VDPPEFVPSRIDLSAAMISRTHLVANFEFPYFGSFTEPPEFKWNEADGYFWTRAANLTEGGNNA